MKKLLQSGCVAVPGAFCPMAALLAKQAGFQAVYLSGAALSASLGVPDIGLCSMDKFVQTIQELYQVSGLPVFSDADTGFGEGEVICQLVNKYYKAGAFGCHIEDQVFPKRCGHLDGKSLIPAEHMVEKIKYAALARDKYTNGSFIVCARTDARGVEGIESTISRSIKYIEAGADMIFPEGLQNLEEFEKVAQELRKIKSDVLLLANMTEFGKTPYITKDQFQNAGYNMVIYPVSAFRVAMKSVQLFYEDLQTNGTQSNFVDKMQTRKELYNTLNYDPMTPWIFPNN